MMKEKSDNDIRFVEADKRMSMLEKRIDDVKWLIGSLAGLFTVVFSVMTLVISWNYGNERASLREFQRDLREDLGKAQPTPKVEILGPNGLPLSGQTLKGKVKVNKYGFPVVSSESILRNIGSVTTGLISIKVYTKKGLPLDSPSTDESAYSYETYITPKDIEPNTLPPKLSTNRVANIVLTNKNMPPPGRHPMLFKVYFGKDQVAQSEFTVLLSR